MSLAIALAERGFLPDPVVRYGIRRLLAGRLRSESSRPSFGKNANACDAAPIALLPGKANEQHYEVPPEFFERVLGARLKYSCCLWEAETGTLDEAEEKMLALTALRAGIGDGMRILDLGCGWGSFSLWAAERYPNSEILAVSNSRPQGDFIRQVCRRRGVRNLAVLTADMNDFEAPGRFDRIVSIEMFEHLRNHRRILERVSQWLANEGRVFLHVFCHRELAYTFEDETDTDWMARYFFSGGMMPSERFLHAFQDLFRIRDRWRVNGVHYSKTLEAWLDRLDTAREEALAILRNHYGERDASLWFERWRLFLLACSELFRYRGGEEWFVSHTLLERP